jgi:hypothetical protein
MNSEADQPELVVPAAAEPQAPAPATVKAPKPRTGVPVWRTGKPDAFLAAAVESARTALEGITAAADIGRHLGAKSEGDRLVTHLFESMLPGYAGWQWFAVLTRNSRSKVVTVNELGLLPSEDAILAPEWVPWAERVRPEDEQEAEPEQEREPERPQEPEQEPEAGQPQDTAVEGHDAESPEEDPEGDAGTERSSDNDAVTS